ncbi:MAG: methylenetetrahydrofolate reductase [NAD(P)H] [Verrucomicrobiaceae bacterium]|nr:methylenetetrahydrofolate reductase [NAD(P)H] [Verrucomicrobiaceae bacterium]
MHINDILTHQGTSFSFEFFPPKTAGSSEKLFETIKELESCRPSFVSITYGAGGSTRQLTHDLVVQIKNTTSLTPIPHLTCVCHSETEISAILTRYANEGVDNILALRGDPPSDHREHDHAKDTFQYAGELVKAIKQFNTSGKHPASKGFGIGVAGFPEGHPDTPNRIKELDHLKSKVDQGADYICTQMFFDNHDFLDFRDRCDLAGITIPIIAGIMPINSLGGMQRMAQLAAGTRFPARLLAQMENCKDNSESVRQVGIDYATEQCSGLLDNNVNGIHFYTLNKSDATRQIFANLGLKDFPDTRTTTSQ